EDMDAVIEAFASAAGLVGAFQAIELNMAQGYLLASFLSPLTNRRTDEFGGDLDARLRFPLRVLEAVREAWAGPVAVRITATDWHPRGATVDDAVEIAKAM